MLQPTIPTDQKVLVNNVIFVIDESGSMTYHSRNVEKVMASLADSLKNSPQMTRVSLYSFSSTVKREAFCQPPEVLRNMKHVAHGQTALIDAVIAAVTDHRALPIPRNEDHSYLVYVITDGEENGSRKRSYDLRNLLTSLPDNWTVATLVPNLHGVHSAKNCGFMPGNIEVWNVSSANGFEEVGHRLSETYATYTNLRAKGSVGTRSLFVNTTHLNNAVVQQNLVEDTSSRLFTTNDREVIALFVEKMTGKPYVKGTTFYELTKAEELQGYKEIAVLNKSTGKRYFGADARNLLGLPFGITTRIRPGSFGEWRVFVQSTSLNRVLPAGTSILVR